MPAYFDSETNKKKGQAPFSFNDIEGKSVVASKAWQSLREKKAYLFLLKRRNKLKEFMK